jgi:mRNA-degrading endonuclease RelE of RelBE toxin-antitoxin system
VAGESGVGRHPPIQIRFSPTYEKDVKRAGLGAETARLLSLTWAEILAAVNENLEYPQVARAGDPIPRNNREIYKLRMADPSRNKGARGSYRIIYWLRRQQRELVALHFYHKSEKENVVQKEIDAARAKYLASNG